MVGDARRQRRREERRLARRRASRRGSPRGPRRSPCRASRRPRRARRRSSAVELERPAADVIERAPGRRDDDVDAALERAELLLHRAARRRSAARARRARGRTGGPPRRPASRARGSGRGPAPMAPRAAVRLADEALEHRQRERRGLAGAGRGLAEDVASLEERRDRLALDRGRLLVAERGERIDQDRIQAQRRERAPALGDDCIGFGAVHHCTCAVLVHCVPGAHMSPYNRRPVRSSPPDTRRGLAP